MKLIGSKNIDNFLRSLLAGVLIIICGNAAAQNATAIARMDATRITVGDQARLFIEVRNNPSQGTLQWAAIPDTFNTLEVTERGRIDTIKNGDGYTYKQRLLITGFDSGVFTIPAFVFSVIPSGGTAYTVQTDSFALLVQSVAVDTTKQFRGIKGIIYVKSGWRDYIGLIIGGILFIALVAFVIIYFVRNKGFKPKPRGPVESLQDYTLRLLAAVEAKQLWQKNQVKQYYVELTDILRNYIEHRFDTPALEATTEELLEKAHLHPDMQPYYDLLFHILQTADLAKFAKFQPLPQEHTDTMDRAKQFVETSRPAPVITEPSPENKTPTA